MTHECHTCEHSHGWHEHCSAKQTCRLGDGEVFELRLTGPDAPSWCPLNRAEREALGRFALGLALAGLAARAREVERERDDVGDAMAHQALYSTCLACSGEGVDTFDDEPCEQCDGVGELQ